MTKEEAKKELLLVGMSFDFIIYCEKNNLLVKAANNIKHW